MNNDMNDDMNNDANNDINDNVSNNNNNNKGKAKGETEKRSIDNVDSMQQNGASSKDSTTATDDDDDDMMVDDGVLSMGSDNFRRQYTRDSITQTLIDQPSYFVSPPCDKMLIRNNKSNHKTITIMGDKIDPDDSIGVLMRSPVVRTELMRAYSSLGLLNDVIKRIFGSTNTVRASTPYYNSDTVLSSVNNYMSDYSLETRLVYASTLSELLDVFEMREGSLKISLIINNELPIVPNKKIFLKEAVDVDLVDKFLHSIGKFHKHVKDQGLPKGNFRMSAYTDALFLTHQSFTRHLQDVEVSEAFLNDTLILLLRHLTRSESEITKFGHYDHHILQDMAKNATLVRLAYRMKDSANLTTKLPSHMLESECARTMRLAGSLANYEVIHSPSEAVSVILTNRPGHCGLLSATILNKRNRLPFTEGLRVVSDPHHSQNYKEISAIHSAYKNMIPDIPKEVFNLMRNRAIHANEVLAYNLPEKTITVVTENEPFALYSDVASMLASHTVVVNDLKSIGRRGWLTNDKFERLNLPKSLFKGLMTVDPILVILALSEQGVVPELEQIEDSLLNNGKRFFGVVQSNITLRDLYHKITILNPYDQSLFKISVVADKANLPVYSQLFIESQISLVDIINSNLSAIQNLKEYSDSNPMKGHFIDSLVTLVVTWTKHSSAFINLLHRCISEAAVLNLANSKDVEEMYKREAILRANAHDLGIISFSAAIAVLQFLEGKEINVNLAKVMNSYAYEALGRQVYNVINNS